MIYIAFFRTMIYTGARPNPVTCGTNQGNKTTDLMAAPPAGVCDGKRRAARPRLQGFPGTLPDLMWKNL